MLAARIKLGSIRRSNRFSTRGSSGFSPPDGQRSPEVWLAYHPLYPVPERRLVSTSRNIPRFGYRTCSRINGIRSVSCLDHSSRHLCTDDNCNPLSLSSESWASIRNCRNEGESAFSAYSSQTARIWSRFSSTSSCSCCLRMNAFSRLDNDFNDPPTGEGFAFGAGTVLSTACGMASGDTGVWI